MLRTGCKISIVNFWGLREEGGQIRKIKRFLSSRIILSIRIGLKILRTLLIFWGKGRENSIKMWCFDPTQIS